MQHFSPTCWLCLGCLLQAGLESLDWGVAGWSVGVSPRDCSEQNRAQRLQPQNVRSFFPTSVAQKLSGEVAPHHVGGKGTSCSPRLIWEQGAPWETIPEITSDVLRSSFPERCRLQTLAPDRGLVLLRQPPDREVRTRVERRLARVTLSKGRLCADGRKDGAQPRTRLLGALHLKAWTCALQLAPVPTAP